jgi:hypothetical protein
VTGYNALIPSLALPDPDDRHVIEAQHPDDFLSNHLKLAPGLFCEAIRKVRARLKNPPFTAPQYLTVLTQQGLVATASELVPFSGLI